MVAADVPFTIGTSIIWAWIFNASLRNWSQSGMLKFGYKVKKTVPALRVAWTFPKQAYWYSLSMVSKRTSQTTVGRPLRPCKIISNLTAPKCKWVYPCEIAIRWRLREKGSVKKCSCEPDGTIRSSNLLAWTYSLTGSLEEFELISFLICLVKVVCEGLTNTWYGLVIGRSV